MPTRPSSSAVNIIQDAKQLLARGKRELPALLKADKAKGKTAGTNMGTLKTLETNIAAFEKATTAQRGQSVTAKASTSAEVAARGALAGELKSIRDDVRDAAPKDIALQKEFGRGAKLESKTTPVLLAAADGVLGSFDARAADVKSAGVNKARIAKLSRLRAALANADATQRGAIATRGGVTSDKSSVLAEIRTAVAQLRRRLGPGSPGVKNTSARRAVKKRTPKPPPVTPTTPTS